MDRTDSGGLPAGLCHWITFLTQAVPWRSVPVFIELLMGAMLSRRGCVTDALQAISPQRHWTSYYKWLEHGQWSWKRLGQWVAILVRCVVLRQWWYLAIDDTLCPRVSTTAPGSARYYLSSPKPNRPRYIQGQCWVNLSAVVSRGRRFCCALPLLWRLQRPNGSSTKLRSAEALIRTVGSVFQDQRVRLLLDSWYMRQRLIEYSLQWGFTVIGQVRIDTALYDVPEPAPPGRRGRPRIYGGKYDRARIATLPEQRRRLWIYGKARWVRYRTVQAKARFLKERRVRAVWVQIEQEDGALSPTRLLLSTDAELRAEVVIKAYARRWAVEPLYNQFRHHWGAIACWQQTRQTLARWVQVLSTAYTLVHLLALLGGPAVASFAQLTPWRRAQPLTAGQIRIGLRQLFQQVNVRAWWDPKSRKFRPPNTLAPPAAVASAAASS